MESLSKIKLTTANIQDIIKKAFGNDAVVTGYCELDDGWFNTIYKISAGPSMDLVLKIAPPANVKVLRYEKALIRAEVSVLNCLKEKTDIPVPGVLFADFSCSVIENEYFIMEKLPGECFNKIQDKLMENEKSEIKKQIGCINRKINNIKGSRFGYYAQEERQTNSWSAAFLLLISDILDDAKDFGVELPLPYNRIYDIFLAQEKVLDIVTIPSLVHWDLHGGNVIIGQDKRITGIIDCDRALWGDPLIEFYFSSMFSNPADFMTGYTGDLLSTDEAKCRRTLYDLYLALIMVIECSSRGYTNLDHRKWVNYNLEKQLDIFTTK